MTVFNDDKGQSSDDVGPGCSSGLPLVVVLWFSSFPLVCVHLKKKTLVAYKKYTPDGLRCDKDFIWRNV